jgi:hypothetical protein
MSDVDNEQRKEEEKKEEDKLQKVELPAEKSENIALDKDTEDMWKGLNEKANDNTRAFFEYLMTNDEYQYNGIAYKYKMIKRKDMGELIKLRTQAINLDKTKDFQNYSENIMKRACIVIQDMTPQKFDEEDYELLENITVAWSLKDRGFRNFKQSPRSVL